MSEAAILSSIQPFVAVLLPPLFIENAMAFNSMHIAETTGSKQLRSLYPQEFGTMNSFAVTRSLQLEDVSVYECSPPLGPLKENWYTDTSSPTGQVCYNNTATCCGPLQNITSCTDLGLNPWPRGEWINGSCAAYSLSGCCFDENGVSYYTFPSCFESQEQIPGQWFSGTCTAALLSECCETPQNFTECPDSTKPWPGGEWIDGVCSGLKEECCFYEDGVLYHTFPNCFESQEQIPGQWYSGTCTATRLSECCGTRKKFTSCADASTDPWPGGWSNGLCYGYSAYDCCYTENGFTLWNFSACYESQEKILANWVNDTCMAYSLSTCCSTLQNDTLPSNVVYRCEAPLGPLRENWSINNYSPTGRVCYNTNASCCGPIQDITSCPNYSEYWPGGFVKGLCKGYSPLDCCYTEDGSTIWNFHGCYEGQQKIGKYWVGDTCAAVSRSKCCQSSKNSTSTLIGFVVGGVVLVVCLVIGIAYRRRRKKSDDAPNLLSSSKVILSTNDFQAPSDEPQPSADDSIATAATAAPVTDGPGVTYKDQCRNTVNPPSPPSDDIVASAMAAPIADGPGGLLYKDQCRNAMLPSGRQQVEGEPTLPMVHVAYQPGELAAYEQSGTIPLVLAVEVENTVQSTPYRL
jgi:hypothetical protein